jgi:hypothetical protein
MSLPLSSLSGARQLPRAAPSSPVFSHGWTVADGRRLQGAWRRTTRDPASPSRARLQTQPVRASAPFDSSVGAVGRRLVEAPRSGRGEPPKRHADVTEIRQNLALGSGMSGLGVERVEWSTVELACPVSLPRQRQCGRRCHTRVASQPSHWRVPVEGGGNWARVLRTTGSPVDRPGVC